MIKDLLNFEDLFNSESIKQLFILAIYTVIFCTAFFVLINILNNDFDFIDQFTKSIDFLSNSIEYLLLSLFLLGLVLYLAYACVKIIFQKVSYGNNQFISLIIFILWASILIAIILEEFNIIVAGATIILVIITGYNVTQTRINEEKRLDAEIEPIIHIYKKDPDKELDSVSFFITNYGRGVAINLIIDIQKDQETHSSYGVGEENLVGEKIQILPPGEHKEFLIYYFHKFWDEYDTKDDDKQNSNVECKSSEYVEDFKLIINVKYMDSNLKERKTDPFSFDLSEDFDKTYKNIMRRLS